jgi:hypothetical protein
VHACLSVIPDSHLFPPFRHSRERGNPDPERFTASVLDSRVRGSDDGTRTPKFNRENALAVAG